MKARKTNENKIEFGRKWELIDKEFYKKASMNKQIELFNYEGPNDAIKQPDIINKIKMQRKQSKIMRNDFSNSKQKNRRNSPLKPSNNSKYNLRNANENLSVNKLNSILKNRADRNPNDQKNADSSDDTISAHPKGDTYNNTHNGIYGFSDLDHRFANKKYGGTANYGSNNIKLRDLEVHFKKTFIGGSKNVSGY